VTSSDFKSDPDAYEKELDLFLRDAEARSPSEGSIRLRLSRGPPIFSDPYEFLESLGARVVFNETQRQFSMPFDEGDLVDQYLNYTYPYGIRGKAGRYSQGHRGKKAGRPDSLHQTFCFRQIYDILLRESLSLPVLDDRRG